MSDFSNIHVVVTMTVESACAQNIGYKGVEY